MNPAVRRLLLWGNPAPSATVGTDPATVSGRSLSLDAEVSTFQTVAGTAAADGDPVGQIVDGVASLSFEQATAGQRPVRAAAIFGTHSALRFTRASSQVLSNANGTPVIKTLFIVFKSASAGNWSGYQGLVNGQVSVAAEQYAYAYDGTTNLGSNGGAVAALARVDGVGGSAAFADAAPIASAHVYEVASANFTTGSGIDLGFLQGNDFFNGWITRVEGFDTVLSAGVRSGIRQWLGARYGVTVTP
jgi:hypothetical protein